MSQEYHRVTEIDIRHCTLLWLPGIPYSENGLIIALPAFMVSLNRPTAM